MKLSGVEKLFNELFNFEKLLSETKEYVEKTLSECETNFLSEEFEEGECNFKELRVEYSRTHILINKSEGQPSFRLEFNLYEPNEDFPIYTYEVEYNSEGKFLDEYLL